MGGQNSCLNSFFLTNVPYNFLPPFPDNYIALDQEIFVFKPREWRGTNADGAPPFSEGNYLTEAEMAAEINGYDPGTVAHLYLTRLARSASSSSLLLTSHQCQLRPYQQSS